MIQDARSRLRVLNVQVVLLVRPRTYILLPTATRQTLAHFYNLMIYVDYYYYFHIIYMIQSMIESRKVYEHECLL